MRYLLDTHTFIWWVEGTTILHEKARLAIENANSKVYVSVVTAWEIAIKVQLGKLNLELMTDTPAQYFYEFCEKYGFEILPIFADHVLETYNLPLLHRDPFDRILIAQARTENLTLITGDPLIQRYEVTALW